MRDAPVSSELENELETERFDPGEVVKHAGPGVIAVERCFVDTLNGRNMWCPTVH